jgi:hypothetical protein
LIQKYIKGGVPVVSSGLMLHIESKDMAGGCTDDVMFMTDFKIVSL